MNPLCKILGIRYPIIQAPMNWVSGATLVATVSNAGGLGTLGPNAGAKTISSDVTLMSDIFRSQIRKVKGLTNQPFAINIAISTGENRKYSQRCVEIALEEGVPVAIVSVGSPDVYTKVLKEEGMKVLHAISTVRHAIKAEEAGVDGVICEGFEGGGGKGFTELTTLVLIPMVADTVNIPIVAGGGISDVRGVLASFILGADGVYMGTRFMVTHESDAHSWVKKVVVEADDVCTVSIPRKMMLGRNLTNLFTKRYLEMKGEGLSEKELEKFIKEHSEYHAQVQGDYQESEVFCGQVAGLIKNVIGAGEVIEDIISNLSFSIENLQKKIKPFL